MPTIRAERTGWRDQGISERHRRWGWDCPAIDLDFVLLEYDKGVASALVEYKHEAAQPAYRTHPSYQALIDLGDRAELPVFAVRYADDYTWYRVTALNSRARDYVPVARTMTEQEWVCLLYRVRDIEIPPGLFTDTEMEL